MSAAIDLLRDLKSLGVNFTVDGDEIKLTGNREALTPDAVEALRAHRGEVLTFLKRQAEHRHGYAINGHPKTWTGNIVSLDEWRRLSEWERHGPNGRQWNGGSGMWE